MDLHRARRLAKVLVISQLRSGRSGSDPTSFLGRPSLILVIDAVLFAVPLFVGEAGVLSAGSGILPLATLVTAFLPFVPLIAVAAVLVAGVMFELTATAKFSGSDAVNWLPLTPREYVAASSGAIAYAYSPAIALFLGITLPFAAATGLLGAWLLATFLAMVSLLEGAFLVEMVRAATQRASSVSVGRRGHLTLALRAVLLIVVILAFQLAFNPVFLFGLLQRFSALGLVVAVVPFFWATEALRLWTAGQPMLGVGFALATVGFTALLLAGAAQLRVRYWMASATEIRLEAHEYAVGHPILRGLGLTPPESALVSKDLRGYVRRRELLPLLVVPVVLLVLVMIEGSALGGLGAIIWVAWVAGFFALLLAVTSVGQERRSLQSLFAYPISARSILRAKAFSVLIPSLIAAVGMAGIIGLLFRLTLPTVAAIVLLTAGGAVVLTLWGLVFAARFSDFQDRPRPQYLRPSAMLGATGSGMVLLFAIVVPGAIALQDPVGRGLVPAVVAASAALVAGSLALHWARTGFDRLFRELPF